MTVAEFIEELRQYPQELTVTVDYSKDFVTYVNHEYYDGDPANPDCPVITCLCIV